ncbi:MAG: hypothetical protein KW804_02320 [Candidatus Doudnabacteria bacterium]|nr:hypothetical protein [Candidatus Doudnabacteria bacterium]
MYEFASSANLVIQGCMLAVLIGVFYNLMISTKAYGGIVGKSIRLIGIGILFFSLSAIERALVNFSIIQATIQSGVIQDAMSLLGLVFLGLGFSKLATGTKTSKA